MFVIVGGVIEKDGKYLLVQEASGEFRGKWNLPAGHLELNELFEDGAKREIKEESGIDSELIGICQIGQAMKNGEVIISMVFTARQIGGALSCDGKEIMEVKWFTYDEILGMREKIRYPDFVIRAINNAQTGAVAPLEILNTI